MKYCTFVALMNFIWTRPLLTETSESFYRENEQIHRRCWHLWYAFVDGSWWRTEWWLLSDIRFRMLLVKGEIEFVRIILVRVQESERERNNLYISFVKLVLNHLFVCWARINAEASETSTSMDSMHEEIWYFCWKQEMLGKVRNEWGKCVICKCNNAF